MIEINPEIADAYRSGAVRGIDLVSQAAFRVAQAGDPGMSRFWLERLGGPQFNRKPDGPAVIVQTGPIVQIDQEAMDRRFDRQRALIDGTADELKDHESRAAWTRYTGRRTNRAAWTVQAARRTSGAARLGLARGVAWSDAQEQATRFLYAPRCPPKTGRPNMLGMHEPSALCAPKPDRSESAL
jgi:hypothetical protein